jgi:hypothetical protein
MRSFLCSFTALIHARFDLVVGEIASIVQAGDIQEQLEDHAAARGIQLISGGFPLITKDDHETVERASFVYDALYASIRQGLTVS